MEGMDRHKILFLSQTIGILKGYLFHWLLRTEDFNKLGLAFIGRVCRPSIALYDYPLLWGPTRNPMQKFVKITEN